jgi:hypothetical protein
MNYQTREGLADYSSSMKFRNLVGECASSSNLFITAHGDSLQLPYQSLDNNGRFYVNCSSRLDTVA